MVGDEARAKKILVGYMSAQLQSGLAALEAAVNLHDTDLSSRAAQRYLCLAEIARQLYSYDEDYEVSSLHKSHNFSSLLAALEKITPLVVERTRRLPYVQGDSRVQQQLLREICLAMNAKKLTVGFRRRGEDLVVSLRGDSKLSDVLTIAGSRHPLFAAAKQPSLTAIEGYMLARRAAFAGLHLVVVRSVVYVHFKVFRQLQMPF